MLHGVEPADSLRKRLAAARGRQVVALLLTAPLGAAEKEKPKLAIHVGKVITCAGETFADPLRKLPCIDKYLVSTHCGTRDGPLLRTVGPLDVNSQLGLDSCSVVDALDLDEGIVKSAVGN